jgi:hypothetical protein
MELEVTYFIQGRYKGRKSVEVEEHKANNVFLAACKKLQQRGEEALVTLRLNRGGNWYLVNSQHTNKYDPKGSIQPKIPAGSKK